jgi:pimeloyl-ACP methyl ester carboxylesterase
LDLRLKGKIVNGEHPMQISSNGSTFAMIKGARFLEIAQAGHISNIEKPAIFNAAAAKLLDDVEQGLGG